MFFFAKTNCTTQNLEYIQELKLQWKKDLTPIIMLNTGKEIWTISRKIHDGSQTQ